MEMMLVTLDQNSETRNENNTYIQLNKYESGPNFIQLTQNLTSDCLLI